MDKETNNNLCTIEYDERELGHAFVSKVYTPGGVDISIRFVKQRTAEGNKTYDPKNCPEGKQRIVLNLTLENERRFEKWE